MLLSEFIDRTGYQPTAEEYAEIEKEYYHFKGDKDAYCRAWCKSNPSKAGTLTAKIKENDRKGKVFDKLVRHIVRYAKRKDFDRNMLYYMNYRDQCEHVDFVCKKTGATNHVELWEMVRQLGKSDAITSSFSGNSWEYFRILEKIV